jgi:hypothetical protein
MGRLTNLNPPAALTDSDIPGSIARDAELTAALAELTAALTAHVNAPDPHSNYLRKNAFDPASHAQTFTASVKAVGVSGGGLTQFPDNCGFGVIASDESSAAFLSFLRPGIYGVHLGLGTDNQMRIGGWSAGANSSWRLWHEGYGEPVMQSPSDRGLKQNIRPIPSALALLLECQPISFRYNRKIREKKDFFGSSYQRNKVHYGFLANDIPLQDLVIEKDNGYLGLDYLEIIPFLVRALQELHEEIVTLKEAAELNNL